MLEVINGFLLVYFVILCTLNTILSHLVKPIAACFIKNSDYEQMIWEEILKLKEEQKHMSMKDEFAAYSKLQRKVFKLETELKDKSQTRLSKNIAIKSSIKLVLQVLLAVVTVLSVIWFRQEPIVALKGDLFPLTTILRYPSTMPNAISTHVWVFISNFSVKTLLKPVIS